MMSEGSRTQGHHGARDSVKTSLSLETVKLLKTQDAGYLRVMGDKVRKQIEQLEKEVKLQEGLKVSLSNKGEVVMDDDVEDEDMDIDIDFESDEGPRNSTVGRKTVFVDSVEEQRGYVGGVNGRNEGGDRDERKGQDKTAEQQKSKKQIEIEERTRKELQAAKKMKKRAAESRQRKLQALKKQYQDITAAQQELDLQRAKMDHSVGGVNKYGVKWKVRERKS